MFRSGLEINNYYNLQEKEFIDEVIKVTKISALPRLQQFNDEGKNKITEFTIWTHPIYVFSYVYGTLQEKNGALFCRVTVDAPQPVNTLIVFLCNKLSFLFLGIVSTLIIAVYSMGWLTPQHTDKLTLVFGVITTLYGGVFLVVLQNIYLKKQIEMQLKQHIKR